MQVDQNSRAFALSGISSPGGPGIADLVPDQLRRFTRKSLRAKAVRPFDVRRVLDALYLHDGMNVLAVDMGGDKITTADFTVRDGRLESSDHVVVAQGDNGVGYVAVLRELADSARRRDVPVGISFAGPISGSRLVAAPNLPFFAREFQASYEGDFASLFWKVELSNDAEAGIMAAALEAARRYPDCRDVIYVINGSGLGGAVLAGTMIYATEPGHIPVVTELNDFGGFTQHKQCGLDGATYVCIEAVGASKAGVEDIWHQMTGNRLTGQQISGRFLDGDELARGVYFNSARITAHAIKGVGAAFGLFQTGSWPVVIGHGGIFQVPGYGELVRGILAGDLGRVPQILFTKDFSANTCLEGAAIAVAGRHALIRSSR